MGEVGIGILNNCNPLTLLSFQNIVEKDLEWYKNIKNILNHIGLGNILSGDISNPEVEVFKRF